MQTSESNYTNMMAFHAVCLSDWPTIWLTPS